MTIFDPSKQVTKAFAAVEREGEVIAAMFRALIAAVLILVVLFIEPQNTLTHPLFVVTTVYAAISLAGVGLAVARISNRFLPYVFVTVDSVTIALALKMLGAMQSMDMGQTMSLPLFSLAFVVLIHAALRYRPSLVVYGAVVFVGLLLLLPQKTVYWHSDAMQKWPSSPAMNMGMRSGVEYSMNRDPEIEQYMPLLFFGIGALVLFFIVYRTRKLATRALVDGKRVAQLARFFSPEVANKLITHDHDALPLGRRQHVAALFIDIRGFTRLSEGLTPEALSEMLASFRTTVTRIIFNHGGTVDKFIGDAVLAVFGTPTSHQDDAKRAVKAAFAISQAVQDWFDRRQQADRPAALVGIGADYGEVFAGVIESGQVLEHSVIGDAVNVAQRLERMTRTLDANVVLSAELIRAARIDPKPLKLQCKPNVTLAGHQAPVTLYHDQL
ncbi:MAG: adenylate/guanylate cyclase domain-containing protein [Gammaproteobacteria bacterium]